MSRREAKKIEVSVTMKHETDRAILVLDGDREVWLPKSQVSIEGDEFPEPGESAELFVPEWLAKEKGLI